MWWRLTLLLWAALPAVVSGVEVTVFLERDAWQAAAGQTELESFNDVSLGPLLVGETQAVGRLRMRVDVDRLDEQGLGILPGNHPLAIDGTRFLGGGIFHSELWHVPTFYFDTPTTAFAADWTNIGPLWGMHLEYAAESLNLQKYLPHEDGFVGLVFSSPISQLRLTAPYQDLGIDNVAYQVPEPSSAGLAGLLCGLLGLWLMVGRC